MEYNNSYDNGSYDRGRSEAGTGVFAVLMRNVYTWMACGLAMTALTALIVGRNENWVYALASNAVLFWGLLVAEVALVMFLSVRLDRLSFATAGLMFAAYAVLNGVTLSFIVMLYTAESIAQTFFVTAGTFGGMSLFGYFTRRDLSAMGRALVMALVGLIVATLVNMFWQNGPVATVLNYAGVLIFVGLTAYDTQKIKRMMLQAQHAGVGDQTNKLALMGSLMLYLDFVNLFLHLLRIMGRRR